MLSRSSTCSPPSSAQSADVLAVLPSWRDTQANDHASKTDFLDRGGNIGERWLGTHICWDSSKVPWDSTSSCLVYQLAFSPAKQRAYGLHNQAHKDHDNH